MKQYFFGLFTGRVNRSTYFFGLLTIMLIFITLTALFRLLRIPGLIYTLILFYFIVIEVSLIVRRCHDLGRPGAFGLFLLVPLANFFVYIYLFLSPSKSEKNEYGHLPKRFCFKEIFGIK